MEERKKDDFKSWGSLSSQFKGKLKDNVTLPNFQDMTFMSISPSSGSLSDINKATSKSQVKLVLRKLHFVHKVWIFFSNTITVGLSLYFPSFHCTFLFGINSSENKESPS